MWTEVCGRKWTEVCGRKFVEGSLLTEVVDESCGRKLWTVDGNDFRSSLLG